jgi:hypothetical protein
MTMKQCPKCTSPRPESDFYVNNRSPDRLTYYCKQHHREIIDRSRGHRRAKPTVKAGNVSAMRDGSIDAGLVVLSLTTPDGVALTNKEIAKACGCSLQYINQIEHQALRKLRNAFLSDPRIQQFTRGQIAA